MGAIPALLIAGAGTRPRHYVYAWWTRGRAIDTRVPQEQTIAVRWILRVLRAIPLTPCWARARRRQNRRAMLEHLRRYYANEQ